MILVNDIHKTQRVPDKPSKGDNYVFGQNFGLQYSRLFPVFLQAFSQVIKLLS